MKKAIAIVLMVLVPALFSGCKKGKSCKEIIDAVDDGKMSSSSPEASKCFDAVYDICVDWLTGTNDWEKDRAVKYCKEDPWRVL